jgi:hypothetical protein
VRPLPLWHRGRSACGCAVGERAVNSHAPTFGPFPARKPTLQAHLHGNEEQHKPETPRVATNLLSGAGSGPQGLRARQRHGLRGGAGPATALATSRRSGPAAWPCPGCGRTTRGCRESPAGGCRPPSTAPLSTAWGASPAAPAARRQGPPRRRGPSLASPGERLRAACPGDRGPGIRGDALTGSTLPGIQEETTVRNMLSFTDAEATHGA